MFGIAKDFRSEVRVCTPDLLNQALDSPQVAKTCAELEDALEAYRSGNLTKDEYETLKAQLKKRLPIATFHATFKNGRRKNNEAIPSGLCIYDLDHIPNPREKWAEIEARKELLGILLAHITPSTEGLRLVFVIPMAPGTNRLMSLAEAQAWMAVKLGDTKYDACVKDYARCSFLVPREYVLYMDTDGLFSPQIFSDKVLNNSSQINTDLSINPADGNNSPQITQINTEVLNGPADGNNSPQITQINTDENLPSEGIQMENKENNPCKSVESVVNKENNPYKSVESVVNKENNPCKSVESVVNRENNLCESVESVVNKENNLCKSVESVVNKEKYPQTYKGMPYTKIVETLEEQMGGRPEHGSRNNFIFSMACHLRYICDDDPDWIASILPTYGEGREKWMATIRSACARNQTQAMPNIMRRTLSVCKQILRYAQDESQGDTQASTSDASTPPEMPKVLPPLIELLVSRTPDIYKPAVAHAVFPALGAHLWHTTFRYIDNVHHEATLMNVLMAGTGAGKNCITEPVNRILADIRKRDKENMLREKAWKKEMQSMGANKNKRQRPEGLVIQEIDPDMTNAAFVQRLADAEGKFLYTKMNEIDQFDALKTSANRKSQFQIMCLAFDPGNVYGQTRVGTSSVTERVCIRFNWNASTTIQKGQHYFRSVLTDGPISRINFCTIPEREIGAPMPVYGSYDDAFDRELSVYIERLNGAYGEVECPEAFALAQTLSEECAEFARLSQSRVYENLSFRANVIAFLKAMVLYVAHGEQWSQEIEDFVRWSLQYDMWCKMHFFGEAIENIANEDVNNSPNKGPQNLLDLLPEVFTRKEAQQMRERRGIRRGSVKNMLANWKSRGYIEIYGDTHPTDLSLLRYIKTKTYQERHALSA